MPNVPIAVRSPDLVEVATPQIARTSASVNGRPSCRTSSRPADSSNDSLVAPASSAFWISSKMKCVRSLYSCPSRSSTAVSVPYRVMFSARILS